MKKNVIVTSALLLGALSLSACGANSESGSEEGTASPGAAETSKAERLLVAETTTEEGGVMKFYEHPGGVRSFSLILENATDKLASVKEKDYEFSSLREAFVRFAPQGTAVPGSIDEADARAIKAQEGLKDYVNVDEPPALPFSEQKAPALYSDADHNQFASFFCRFSSGDQCMNGFQFFTTPWTFTRNLLVIGFTHPGGNVGLLRTWNLVGGEHVMDADLVNPGAIGVHSFVGVLPSWFWRSEMIDANGGSSQMSLAFRVERMTANVSSGTRENNLRNITVTGKNWHGDANVKALVCNLDRFPGQCFELFVGRLLPVDGSGNVSGGFVVDCNPGSGPYAGQSNGNAYLSIRGMTSGETAQSAAQQLAFNCGN